MLIPTRRPRSTAPIRRPYGKRGAKRDVDDLAIAAGRATRKAGVQLEPAGERAQRGSSPPPAPSPSN